MLCQAGIVITEAEGAFLLVFTSVGAHLAHRNYSHSLVHTFTQRLFTECLLCARFFSMHWGTKEKQEPLLL